MHHAYVYVARCMYVYVYVCIIGRAGASPPSRTTGLRCLYVYIYVFMYNIYIYIYIYIYTCIYVSGRPVYQIPLISKCFYVNLFLTKRYSNIFYSDHRYIYTWCMVHGIHVHVHAHVPTCTYTCMVAVALRFVSRSMK